LQVLAFCAVFALSPSNAADVAVAPAPKHMKTVVVGQPTPRRDVAFGCKRVWRCDAQICEWRRGCWGIYGYMEGPYYSLSLAQRQWERDGWPTPRSYRQR
jgi:hypothetical protein